MGDIADAMLNGEMCSQCGEWLGGSTGYPIVCVACERGEDMDYVLPQQPKPRPKPFGCPKCNKHFASEKGRATHYVDVHRGLTLQHLETWLKHGRILTEEPDHE